MSDIRAMIAEFPPGLYRLYGKGSFLQRNIMQFFIGPKSYGFLEFTQNNPNEVAVSWTNRAWGHQYLREGLFKMPHSFVWRGEDFEVYRHFPKSAYVVCGKEKEDAIQTLMDIISLQICNIEMVK